MSFPALFLERWRMGDYSLLTSANIPSYIKQILVHKAKIIKGSSPLLTYLERQRGNILNDNY